MAGKKNEKMKRLVIIISIMVFGIAISFGQKTEQKPKKSSELEVVEIQTSAICNKCKVKLEHDIAFEKGVKSVELDNDTKILTVKYKKGKNSKEKIKKAITKAGYDADEMSANQKAYNALPECCKKGNEPH